MASMPGRSAIERANRFTYVGLEVNQDHVVGHYDLDGRHFVERVEFEATGPPNVPGVEGILAVWYLVAGLSYYKAGAAKVVDLGTSPVTPSSRALLEAALLDGLGEYAYRNELDLSDVRVEGGVDAPSVELELDGARVLTPFGGGIDSVVTVEALRGVVDQSLFVMSPPSGRFAPLERTASATGLKVVRATRHLDPAILAGDPTFLNGHVPVTAMVTLLAAAAAAASGRGGVAMSNEHSASVPNLVHHGRAVNHQWSKSLEAERLLADAVAGSVGSSLVVASMLRDRSELWVAERFSHLAQYHDVFRSCNRAFRQDVDGRAPSWCGECDKCLFIDLVLAPFIERDRLAAMLGVEPLSDVARSDQLRTLVGLGSERKPFECVGDPAECTVALTTIAGRDEWRDVEHLVEIASMVSSDEDLTAMLEPRGVSRVPAAWVR
jgi:hypothetical protein